MVFLIGTAVWYADIMNHAENIYDDSEEQYRGKPPIIQVKIEENWKYFETIEVKEEFKEISDNLDQNDIYNASNFCHNNFIKKTTEEHLIYPDNHNVESCNVWEKRFQPSTSTNESDRTYKSDVGKSSALLSEDNQYCVPKRSSKHLSSQHKELKNNVCIYCNKAFLDAYNLKRHVTTVHEKIKRFICKDCKKDFSHRHNLQRHIDAIHKQIKEFECYICHKMFAYKDQLRIHLHSVHQKQDDFSCEVCEKVFSCRPALNEHTQRVHEVNQAFRCEDCQQVFLCPSYLRAHIHSRHPEIVKKFECEDCYKTFSNKNCLRRHIDWAHLSDDLLTMF